MRPLRVGRGAARVTYWTASDGLSKGQRATNVASSTAADSDAASAPRRESGADSECARAARCRRSDAFIMEQFWPVQRVARGSGPNSFTRAPVYI